jgi:hypothetical protein
LGKRRRREHIELNFGAIKTLLSEQYKWAPPHTTLVDAIAADISAGTLVFLLLFVETRATHARLQ